MWNFLLGPRLPAVSKVTLTATLSNFPCMMLQCYTSRGNKVTTSDTMLTAATKTFELENLPSGAYLCFVLVAVCA